MSKKSRSNNKEHMKFNVVIEVRFPWRDDDGNDES